MASTPEERSEESIPRLPTPPPPASYTPSGATPSTPDLVPTATLPNGGSGSEPTTPIAILKAPQFSSDISGIAKEPATGDMIRDKCRGMICTALKKGRKEGQSAIITFVTLLLYKAFLLVTGD